MIYDSLTHRSLYQTLGPRFQHAFEFLASFNPATAVGRISLDGDNLFALVQSYVSSPASERVFESHRLYADLQFVAAGEEVIYTSPLDRLTLTTPYSTTNDSALYSGPDDTPQRLRAGDFCVLFPQDGHKPCCQWNAASPVKKVVIKVRL